MMGDDKAVHKLIDILTAFYMEGRPFEEDLTFSITKEFLENLKGVLFTKQLVSQRRWEYFFQICYYRMQPTPETYLRNVIYACRQCARIHVNIFERFLSMFAIVLHLRVVTFGKPEVDLSKLIPDIFMALYETELKKSFGRRGGFRRFVEYINNPKYLASNLIGKYATSESNRTAPEDAATEDLEKQVDILFREEKQLPKDFRLEDSQVDRPSINLVQKILKSAKNELSPCVTGLEAKSRDFSKQLKKQLAEEKVCALGQIKDGEQQENILQAVIRYNRTIHSGTANQNQGLLMETCRILENLRGKIETLIGLLNEYDKE